jgi:cell division inhibitor SulA
VSQKSCGVLNRLVRRFSGESKIYCIYRAPNEEMIREHARQGGFPANRISEVVSIIDPVTAE